MIEVRTFEGDAAEASWFINRVWQSSYGKSAPLPVWDSRIMDWRLFQDGRAPRDYLLAAYDKGTLVGTLFAEPARIRLGTEEVAGTHGSRATVACSHRGEGIGGKLARELWNRHRERGARVSLGCVTTDAKQTGFWKGAWNKHRVNGLGFWVYVFDARALARGAFTGTQRNVLTCARPFLRHGFREADTRGVRPYHPNDLPRCMTLVRRMLEPVNLGFTYTSERLAHQLQYRDVPRTFVLEQEGEVRGFVNTHSLELTGQGTHTVLSEVVDLVAFEDSVSSHDRQRLLQCAMQDMERRGVACAGMLRSPSLPASGMLRSGWWPLPGGAKQTCLLPGANLHLPATPNVFTHLC
ncbi:MAG: GNAT family N-acetyltransferase [Myxococcaceae bacterium]|uniref:GNAT family N-acetyltransferase n=1 Tax=Corallococcus sp. BB11-1 TaxID=2996783 RepID=UPI0010E41AB2|nr:GNAT family N-acetyltransferase [Corallococcus sp. BB11-1]MCY1033044.1 GNAT family N-acetyltransferase [Corallococcus sp. BB11-1]RYZ36079.1 MAG: GNAT family N-acetyltransferase [Myxococcaceae bacterium]